MAWMFAATEQDMTVGMHMHYHYVPPLMPPVPFYPHPAIGMIRDKLCTSVKADNRKAAKTGAKTKVLLPPHMPWTGPLTHGTGKEGTGIQQVWMGAGIGVHPFGGIGFVVLEGKPAAGMLSNCLGCWCTAPGFDMMLPFVGLDFVMVPTRGVSVLYGPAPLALDLFVLLLSLLRDLFDFILSKVPDGFWKDVLSDAFDSVMEGAEVFCDAIEHGASPAEALKKGAQAAAYTFVDKSLTRATNWVAGKVDKLIPPNSWAGKALDFGLDKGLGTDRKGLLNAGKDKVMGGADKLTGGFLSEGKKASDAKNSHFGEAEAPNPIGFITDPMEKVAGAANESANAKHAAWKENKAESAAAKGKADAAKKTINDPKATPEQKAAAKKDFNQAKKDQAAAEKGAAKNAQEMKVGADHLLKDSTKKVGGEILKEGKQSVKDEAKKELGIDKDSAAGKLFDKAVDKGMDPAANKLLKGQDDAKKADMKAWEDGNKKKAADAKAKQQQQAADKKAGIEPPKDDRKQEKPLTPKQQEAQAKKALENQDKKDQAKDDKNKALGDDKAKQKEAVAKQKEQQAAEKKQAEEAKKQEPPKKGNAPLNKDEVKAIETANKEFKDAANKVNKKREADLKAAKTEDEKKQIELEHDIKVLDLMGIQNKKYKEAGVHPDEVAQRWGNTP